MRLPPSSRRLAMRRWAVAVLCFSLVVISSAQDLAMPIPPSMTTGGSVSLVVEGEAAEDARSGLSAGGDSGSDDDHSDVFTAAEQRYRRQRMQLRNLKGNIFGMDPPKSKKGTFKGKKGSKNNDCVPVPPNPKGMKGMELKGGKLCVPTIQPTQKVVTRTPTKPPVRLDTGAPSPGTTSNPTNLPTQKPTGTPTVTSKPTNVPTNKPTSAPTPVPAAMFQAASRFRSENQWWHDDEFRPDTAFPSQAPSSDGGQPATLEPTE